MTLLEKSSLNEQQKLEKELNDLKEKYKNSESEIDFEYEYE